MTRVFPNLQAFLAHYAGCDHFGTINPDGTVTDHETHAGYKTAHPEDFTPLSELIPVSPENFGTPNGKGDAVAVKGGIVQIEEAAGDLVLRMDGSGT